MLPVSSDDLRATVRAAPPLIVIDLVGGLTALGEAAVLDAVTAALEQSSHDVLLNFAAVDYINSAGIAITLDALAQVRQSGRRLLITGLTPHYRKIFHMMGLSQHAAVFDSEAAASQAASQN